MSDLEQERVLLIDTCGETAGVAVCVGKDVVAAIDFSPGGASAEIIGAIRRLLDGVGYRMGDLHAVGVVSGPGSFTGMRTGMAAAKGLCEASGVRLIGVSRLAVLVDAIGATGGFVALDAGRGEVYVREVVSGREWVCGDADVVARTQIPSGNDKQEKSLVVAEDRVAKRLAALAPVVRALHVGDALGVVLRKLGEAVTSPDALLDANYVRGENDMYRKAAEPVNAAMPGE